MAARSFFSWLKGSKTSRRDARDRQTSRRFRPTLEALEVREVPAVMSASVDTTTHTWIVRTDDIATSVTIREGGKGYVLTELGSTRQWTVSFLDVRQVEFRGGAGNDMFWNLTGLSATAYGGGGNDTLYGGWGADHLVGGAGD